MVITIKVPVVPVAQPRAKATSRGGHAAVYSPTTIKNSDGTSKPHPIVAFKATVRHALALHFTGSPLTGPLSISEEFVFPRPEKLLKKKSPQGRIPHTTKPDRDNLDKGVLDAMKGLLFMDDKQIFEGTISKWYAAIGEQAHVKIVITELAG